MKSPYKSKEIYIISIIQVNYNKNTYIIPFLLLVILYFLKRLIIKIII